MIADAQTTLTATIRTAIQATGGRLPFDQYMDLALYAPGAGYYVNGRRKIGTTGDFTTAPEISPLYSACLGNQSAELLKAMIDGDILEMGAGTGRMAADLLRQLQILDALPKRYLILETSPEHQATQRAWFAETIPDLLPRIEWLNQLPAPGWRGIILANEVIDAFPVHRVRYTGDEWQEGYVIWQNDQIQTDWAPIQSPGLAQAAQQIPTAQLIPGYQTELNLRLTPWLAAIANCMTQGAILIIDYGYPAKEYYHPERTAGTLQCYHQHQANTKLYQRIGQQDITAHVNFSQLAHAALDQGLQLAGYTTQAQFLINTGLEAELSKTHNLAADETMNIMAGVKQLTLPTAMGERFKVIGFQQQLEELAWQGFSQHDQRAYL